MKLRNLKKLAVTSVFGLGLMVIFGTSDLSSTKAQGWRWGQDRNRNGVNDRYERRRGIDRNRNGINDRYEVDRNRNGVYDGYEYNRRYGNRGYGNGGYYGNDGYYGNNGYGYNNGDYQKGYRDGLHRGRSDAQTNRVMDPNNSSHYRKGNSAYRQGFEQGFYQSYRQYSGRRW